MSLNLLKINEQNSLRARKDLLIIVNCKMRDLTKWCKWMRLLKMMMEIAIVPSRSFQIEVIIAQHRKMNENICFFSLFLSKVNRNYDLGSSDDEQRWIYLIFFKTIDDFLFYDFDDLRFQGVCMELCHFCPNYRHI